MACTACMVPCTLSYIVSYNTHYTQSPICFHRGMSDRQKRPFIERADQLRQKHKQEYPDYKYQPRRRKENVKSVSGKGASAPASPPAASTAPQSSGPHTLPAHQQQHSAFVRLVNKYGVERWALSTHSSINRFGYILYDLPLLFIKIPLRWNLKDKHTIKPSFINCKLNSKLKRLLWSTKDGGITRPNQVS